MPLEQTDPPPLMMQGASYGPRMGGGEDHCAWGVDELQILPDPYLELHILYGERLQPLRFGAELAPQGVHFLS